MTDKDRMEYHNWQVKNGKIKGEIFNDVDRYLDWLELYDKNKSEYHKRVCKEVIEEDKIIRKKFGRKLKKYDDLQYEDKDLWTKTQWKVYWDLADELFNEGLIDDEEYYCGVVE